MGAAAGPYQVFMLVLCVWALLMLVASTTFSLDPSMQLILDATDTFICVIFFADFLYSLARAPRRLDYFVKWGWLDLLSSIPMVGPLRLGRVARLARILRVLRGVRSARAIGSFLTAKRSESAFLTTTLLCLLLIVSGSIAVLQFEKAAGGNIVSGEDALWWAITTLTTVGYGDRFPITSEGRLVAVVLMAAGVGVFGTLSGLVASWFLAPATKEADADLVEIKAILADIRVRLASQQPGVVQSPDR